MKKDPLIFLNHILDCIKNIEEDIEGLTKEEFFHARTITNAIVWNLEVIGEAAKSISQEFRKDYPDIPWQQIAGMRDKLIHQYFGIDLGNVWKVATEDIPLLKKRINQILKKGR